jgi:hypothetical protein
MINGTVRFWARVNGIPGGLIEDLRPLLLVNGETHERAPR